MWHCSCCSATGVQGAVHPWWLLEEWHSERYRWCGACVLLAAVNDSTLAVASSGDCSIKYSWSDLHHPISYKHALLLNFTQWTVYYQFCVQKQRPPQEACVTACGYVYSLCFCATFQALPILPVISDTEHLSFLIFGCYTAVKGGSFDGILWQELLT